MKYQPMFSVAGGPFEPLGEQVDTKRAAEHIAQEECHNWNCRVDWFIATTEDKSNERDCLQNL